MSPEVAPELRLLVDGEQANATTELLRKLGQMGLSTSETEQILEPAHEHSRTLLRDVFGSEMFSGDADVTQADSLAILEHVVFPAYRAAGMVYRGDNTTAERVELRIRELRWYAEGKSASKIMELSGAGVFKKSADVSSVRNKTVKKLLTQFPQERMQEALITAGETGEWPVFRTPIKPEPKPRGSSLDSDTSRPRSRASAERETQQIEAKLDKEEKRIAALKAKGKWRPELTGDASADLDALMDTYPLPVFTSLRSKDLVEVWLREIGKMPLLNAADEVQLSKRIEAGMFSADILLIRTEGGVDILRQKFINFHMGKVKIEGRTVKAIEADRKAAELDAEADLQNLIHVASKDKFKQISNRDLQQRVREGERAKEFLIATNLRLAVNLAKKWTGRGLPFTDLIQEANKGVMKAAEKFDYTKGYKFSTYATWWIKQSLDRAHGNTARMIRLPWGTYEEVKKFSRTKHEMQQLLGEEPTVDELAEELETTPERVLKFFEYEKEIVSLDEGPGESSGNDGWTLADGIPDDGPTVHEQATKHARREQIANVLGALTKREAAIVINLYGLGHDNPRTQEETAQRLGMTMTHFRSEERRVMAKLAHPVFSGILDGLLEVNS